MQRKSRAQKIDLTKISTPNLHVVINNRFSSIDAFLNLSHMLSSIGRSDNTQECNLWYCRKWLADSVKQQI